MIPLHFVDHLVFRVADLGCTERFYTVLLGPPMELLDDSVAYQVGRTLLFFTPTSAGGPAILNKEAVGLNHLAFGVATLEELKVAGAHLDANGVVHSGIQFEPFGATSFIWLDDPDGIRIELYLRSSP